MTATVHHHSYQPGQPGPELAAFEEVLATHMLHVPPRFLGDLRAGVKAHLDQSLLKYSSKLDGVPLCYGKVELISEMPVNSRSNKNNNDSLSLGIPSAAIVFENPCVHLPVKVYWTVFSLRPGTRLVGVVNAAGRDHLGLLVLNYFSAVIYTNQLEAVLCWNDREQYWEDRKTGAAILPDYELAFEVVELIHSGSVLTIVGSLDRMLKSPTNQINKPSPSGKKHNY